MPYTEEDVFVIDVIGSVVSSMKVNNPDDPSKFLPVFFNPGSNAKIIEYLKKQDGTALGGFKYPLVALVMPISEKSGLGWNDVTFPRIVIAQLTKTNTGTENVLAKYDQDGIYKTILRPCKDEFLRQLAWSTFTNMGDPDAFEFTSRDIPSTQPIGQGLNDFVDITEILNLKVPIFSQIKSC